MNIQQMKEAIEEMVTLKNMSRESVHGMVADMIKAAYKKKFGTDENVEVQFDEDEDLKVYAKKTVVDEDNYYSEVLEIPLDEALEYSDDVGVGDIIMIPIDPEKFERSAVQSGKQRSQQSFKDYQNNRIYAEYKAKEGEIIKCYVKSVNKRKDDNGYDLIMNVGQDVEGILSAKNQSPRETYVIGDGVKCYLEKVEPPEAQNAMPQKDNFRNKKRSNDVRIVLSRTSPELVRKLITNQVPEIENGQIEIVKIVRKAGIRTKVAVRAAVPDTIDPVGATVGLKGMRSQAVISELEGEKLDIIRWDNNPSVMIANALTPAKVNKVYLVNTEKKEAVAIVDDNQLGLAIGTKGANVSLAKQLVDWLIEVMTQAQYDEMEISKEQREKAEEIFSNGGNYVPELEPEQKHFYTKEELGVSEDDTLLSDIGLSEELVEKLNSYDIYTAEEYVDCIQDGKMELDLTDEEKAELDSVIQVETVEDEGESFECPSCHNTVPAGTMRCPHCGIEFEYEKE